MLLRFVRELGLQLIRGVVFKRKKDNQTLSQLLIAIAVGIKMRFINFCKMGKIGCAAKQGNRGFARKLGLLADDMAYLSARCVHSHHFTLAQIPIDKIGWGGNCSGRPIA